MIALGLVAVAAAPAPADAADISLRSWSTAVTGADVTSMTIGKPAGVEAGDVLVAQVTVDDGSAHAITAPSGWALVRRSNASDRLGQAIYVKVAGSTEPASYTWSFSPATDAVGGVLAYSGVDTGDPIVASSGATGSGTSATAPSITTTAADTRVLAFFGHDDDTSFTTPSGMTERYDVESRRTAAASDMTKGSPGSTGSKTAVAATSDDWVAQLVALRPQSDVQPPSAPEQSIAESSPDSHASGATLYYRPGGAGGSFTVTAATSDAGSGVERVRFPGLADGFTPGSAADDTEGPYSRAYSWTSGAGASGNQTVTAYDRAGNSSSGTFALVPDATAPATSDDAAAVGSGWHASVVTVTLTAADGGAGVAATYATADGSAPTTASPQGTTVTLASDGTHTIRYFSVDRVGNTEPERTASTPVRVDTTAPSEATLDPLPPLLVAGPVLTATGADATSGVASIAYYHCAGVACTPDTLIGQSTTAPDYPVAWEALPPDGTYRVLARVRDAAGNAFDAVAQTVVIDTAAPAVALTAPAADAFLAGSVVLQADASDAGVGVAEVVFERRPAGGGAWSELGTDDSAPYTASWITGALADGDWELRARAVDAVGNEGSSAPVAVTLDNAAPSGVTLGDPGSVLAGTVVLGAAASDAGVGVAEVVFERRPAGGGAWSEVGSDDSAPYSLGWDTGAVADGLYDLRVVARDRAGNEAGSAVRSARRVDNTPPGAVLTAPVAGTLAAGTVVLAAEASDAGAGVAAVVFERRPAGGGAWSELGSDGSAPYAVDWDTAGLADGGWELRARAVDAAGNEAGSAPVAVTLDNMAPSGVALANPGAVLAGAVVLEAAASDAGAGVAEVVFERRSAGGGTWSELGSDDGAPFSVAWNTGAVADGLYDLRVVARDRAGNETVSSVVSARRVDNTPPSGVALADPGSVLAGAVVLEAAASDAGAGVAEVVFERRPAGGGVWSVLGSDDGAPFSAGWDTGAVADGLYDLRVVARDRAGNETASAVRSDRRVDNTPPSGVALADPGSVLAGAVVLEAAASDTGAGVAEVVFERRPAGGGAWSVLGSDDGAPFSAGWDTGAVADGLYDLRVVARDRAGNETASAVRSDRRVDNTPPSGVVLADPGSVLAGAVVLEAEASDTGAGVAEVVFERRPAGGGAWSVLGSDDSAPFSAGWDTGAVADGLYDLRVVARDRAGNEAVSAVVSARRVDNTTPSAALTAPAAGTLAAGTVALAAEASDTGAGVAEVVFERRPAGGGGAWSAVGSDATSPYGVGWDTGGLADGGWELRARAVDAAGNEAGSAPVAVTLDNTAPSGVALADPGSLLAGAVALTAAAEDAGSGLATVVFERRPAGGVAWSVLGSDDGAPYSTGWDTGAVADGLYDLRVVARDRAGNETASAVVSARRVDNTPPGVTLTAPVAGAFVAGAVALQADASDAGAGVAEVVFERRPAGGGAWSVVGSDTTSPYGVGWDTSGLADGGWELRVRAVDGAGNEAGSASVAVTLDNTAPSGVALADPGSLLAGTVVLEAAASDAGAGVAELAFERRTDGAHWSEVGRDDTNSYAAGWDTSGVADGLYDLRVVARDRAGNETVSAVVSARHVDNTPPSATLTAPAAAAVVAGTVALSAEASDAGAGVAEVVFERRPAGGSAWSVVWRDDTSPYGAAWDTSGLADGGWELRVRAVDAAGNEAGSAPLAVTLETPPPAGASSSGGPAPSSGRAPAPRGPEPAESEDDGSAEAADGAPEAVQSPALSVAGPGAVPTAERRFVALRLVLDRPARLDATLLRKRVAVASWRRVLRRGAQVVQLRIPAVALKRPGRYEIVLTLTAEGFEPVTRKHAVRFAPGAPKAPRGRVEVVLLEGSTLRDPARLGQGVKVLQVRSTKVFQLIADRPRVRVAVLDVDRLNVQIVRDLGLVFPGLRIVALSDSAQRRAEATRAGATLVLPRSGSQDELARALRALALAR